MLPRLHHVLEARVHSRQSTTSEAATHGATGTTPPPSRTTIVVVGFDMRVDRDTPCSSGEYERPARGCIGGAGGRGGLVSKGSGRESSE